MKLIIKEEKNASGKTYFRVALESSISGVSGSYIFNTKPEIDAFVSGFNFARHAASNLVQELPIFETWAK